MKINNENGSINLEQKSLTITDTNGNAIKIHPTQSTNTATIPTLSDNTTQIGIDNDNNILTLTNKETPSTDNTKTENDDDSNTQKTDDSNSSTDVNPDTNKTSDTNETSDTNKTSDDANKNPNYNMLTDEDKNTLTNVFKMTDDEIKNINQQTFKTKYRVLARKEHPDKCNPQPACTVPATKKMKIINDKKDYFIQKFRPTKNYNLTPEGGDYNFRGQYLENKSAQGADLILQGYNKTTGGRHKKRTIRRTHKKRVTRKHKTGRRVRVTRKY
jgi:hypothetical protein